MECFYEFEKILEILHLWRQQSICSTRHVFHEWRKQTSWSTLKMGGANNNALNLESMCVQCTAASITTIRNSLLHRSASNTSLNSHFSIFKRIYAYLRFCSVTFSTIIPQIAIWIFFKEVIRCNLDLPLTYNHQAFEREKYPIKWMLSLKN